MNRLSTSSRSYRWAFASAGLAFIGACAVGIAAARATKSAPPAVISAPDRAFHDPSTELASLDQRLAALEARSSPPGRPDVAPLQPPRVEVASTESPPQRPAPTIAALDHVVETEARDPGWSVDYESDLRSALESAFAQDRLRELRCATSACRVVVEHRSREEQATFDTRFWTAIPSEGIAGVHAEPSADGAGPPTTVLHLVRRGHEDAFAGASSTASKNQP